MYTYYVTVHCVHGDHVTDPHTSAASASHDLGWNLAYNGKRYPDMLPHTMTITDDKRQLRVVTTGGNKTFRAEAGRYDHAPMTDSELEELIFSFEQTIAK